MSFHPKVQHVLDSHTSDAEMIASSTSSEKIAKAFTQAWEQLSPAYLDPQINRTKVTFSIDVLREKLKLWIKEFKDIHLDLESQVNKREVRTDHIGIDMMDRMNEIDSHILPVYKELLNHLDYIESDFSNASIAFKSPLQQALNDLNILYNDVNNEEGPLSDYEKVSVYTHGIEDNGDDFVDSAFIAADEGDIIVHEKRDGEHEYYAVRFENGKKTLSEEPVGSKEKLEKEYANDISDDGRLHFVYETDVTNEHRQQTSDQLADSLIDLGVMDADGDTEIDMFAHSYGGRRSLQFLMDYPDYVRSVTTVGTPYDTNALASQSLSMSYSEDHIPGKIGKNPRQHNEYIDLDAKGVQTENFHKYDNAYTDMRDNKMADELDELQVANPEVYEKVGDAAYTAIAGTDPSSNKYYAYYYGDGAVSKPSQTANDISDDIIDNRYEVQVEGNGIADPAHSYEVEDPEVREIFKEETDASNRYHERKYKTGEY